VSAGSQALAHLRLLLEEHQLTLKEASIQELDRGQKAELLGFSLSQQDGRLQLNLGSDAWTQLEQSRDFGR
jgi:hypothetical protein